LGAGPQDAPSWQIDRLAVLSDIGRAYSQLDYRSFFWRQLLFSHARIAETGARFKSRQHQIQRFISGNSSAKAINEQAGSTFQPATS
jgi:hypothetical protein